MGEPKIRFLCPYPTSIVASQRFRFEQYLNILSQHGFSYEISSFTSVKGWIILQNKGKHLQKCLILLIGIARRFLLLLRMSKVEFVFIHREAAPLGPPIIEWIIAKVLKKKVIYDFDDAIWLTDNVQESYLQRLLKFRSKIASICKWSYKISAGNNYLASFALRFNPAVIVNPTTIDTKNLHNKELYDSKERLKKSGGVKGTIIGWTGTYTTVKYLEQLLPVLQTIEASFPDVTLLVIADRKPDMLIKNMVFKKWSKETEIRDLLLADIGIMPLPDNDWAKGKCGFKALQYMSLEIPAIVSPVGVNQTIIQHDVNGLSCSNPDEWLSSISKLILDPAKRTYLGCNGRQTVVQEYSILSNSATFLSFFQ